MSLNDGSFTPMPSASSTDLRSPSRNSQFCCCCSNGNNRNLPQLADENRSKTRLVRLVFSHLAWQQFVALLFVAKAWDVGFYGEPMAMFAPAMFEDSLDGMCLIFSQLYFLHVVFFYRKLEYYFGCYIF